FCDAERPDVRCPRRAWERENEARTILAIIGQRRSFVTNQAKSPVRTAVQVTPVDQVAHLLVVKAEPVDRPVHQSPVSSARPVMSALPSPLKSPTWTSTQVTAVLQLSHFEVVKLLPLDMPAHQ